MVRRLLIALALLLGACGASGEDAKSQSSTDEATPISFTSPAVGGGEIKAADYAGRDLVLWFWSPW